MKIIKKMEYLAASATCSLDSDDSSYIQDTRDNSLENRPLHRSIDSAELLGIAGPSRRMALQQNAKISSVDDSEPSEQSDDSQDVGLSTIILEMRKMGEQIMNVCKAMEKTLIKLRRRKTRSKEYYKNLTSGKSFKKSKANSSSSKTKACKERRRKHVISCGSAQEHPDKTSLPQDVSGSSVDYTEYMLTKDKEQNETVHTTNCSHSNSEPVAESPNITTGKNFSYSSGGCSSGMHANDTSVSPRTSGTSTFLLNDSSLPDECVINDNIFECPSDLSAFSCSVSNIFENLTAIEELDSLTQSNDGEYNVPSHTLSEFEETHTREGSSNNSVEIVNNNGSQRSSLNNPEIKLELDGNAADQSRPSCPRTLDSWLIHEGAVSCSNSAKTMDNVSGLKIVLEKLPITDNDLNSISLPLKSQKVLRRKKKRTAIVTPGTKSTSQELVVNNTVVNRTEFDNNADSYQKSVRKTSSSGTVRHKLKKSTNKNSQDANHDISLMKKDIEQRLRVHDLSWATQRAIRDENSRNKKIARKNEDLDQQLTRYANVMPANQLILDYDKDNKMFIRVHPELVTKMKSHQKDGVKFMYDSCYGNVSDIKGTNGSGCILAHCMGLGKTFQVIALINTVISYSRLKTKRIIVVCPKSTVMNWVQEIHSWLGDIQNDIKLKAFHLPDSPSIHKKIDVLRSFHKLSAGEANCLLIGYEAFRALVFYDVANRHGRRHSASVRVEVRRYLINPGADLIILDEGHVIKNRKSLTNLAVSEVATKRRIILTGTPIQNNLNEYFCMVSFVKPAFLGNEKEFNEQYAKPIKDGQHKDSNAQDIRLMKMKSYILHKRLANFVQRKEFSVLKDSLPQKFEYVLYVPMTPVQERLYEQYLKRNPFRKDVGGSNLLVDYSFLRKIWTHPKVLERAWETALKKKHRPARRSYESPPEDDEDVNIDNARSITNIWWKNIISSNDLESLLPSNKILLLFEILKLCQERDEKCLIFSAFVAVLDMVEHFMKRIHEQKRNPKALSYGLSKFQGPWVPGVNYCRIDGGTPMYSRQEMITKFNDPHNRVTRTFLISTKAGGLGINLVGANRVIILDTSWNPAIDQQGIFRVYRLGQEKTCYVYRLLALHTMEEKVYSRAVTKQAMSHRVADKKQVDRNFNMAELEELYHFERANMAERPKLAPAEDDLLSTLLLKREKLIYRYHTHERMLDNKTEQDLTDLEKQVAWTEYKKKGLVPDDDPVGDIRKSNSQLSEPDVDTELRSMFEKACASASDTTDKSGTNLDPIPIPPKQSMYTTRDERLLDNVRETDTNTVSGLLQDSTSTEDLSADIYCLESDMMDKIKSEIEIDHARVNFSMREQNEISDEANQVSEGSLSLELCRPHNRTSVDCLNSHEERVIEVPHSFDSVDLSPDVNNNSVGVVFKEKARDINLHLYERNSEPSTIDINVRRRLMVNLLANKLPNIDHSSTLSTMSTTNVEIRMSETKMIRGLKRKYKNLKISRKLSKKFKKANADLIQHSKRSIVGIQNNQCRSLVPYVNKKNQHCELNHYLKVFLDQKLLATTSNNNCRAMVPYVKRVSYLEKDFNTPTSSALVINSQNPSTLIEEAAKLECQIVMCAANDKECIDITPAALIRSGVQTALFSGTTIFSPCSEQRTLKSYNETENKNYNDGKLKINITNSFKDGMSIKSIRSFGLPQANIDSVENAGIVSTSFTYSAGIASFANRSSLSDMQTRRRSLTSFVSLGSKRKLKLRNASASRKKIRIEFSLSTISDTDSFLSSRNTSITMCHRRQCHSSDSTFATHLPLIEENPPMEGSSNESALLMSDSSNSCQAVVPFVKRVSFLESILPAKSIALASSHVPTTRSVSLSTTLSWGEDDIDSSYLDDTDESEDEFHTAQSIAVQSLHSTDPSLNESRKQLVQSKSSTVAIYYPVRSFWKQEKYDELLNAKRRGQVIRIQRNQRFRFTPYDKNNRKLRKAFMQYGNFELPEIVAPNDAMTLVQKTLTTRTSNSSLALIPYKANPFLSTIQDQVLEKPKTFVFHAQLSEYLTFCSSVTCQSTMIQPRGLKRKLERENSSSSFISPKKVRCSDSTKLLFKSDN
ncbi:uncharacterized protein LOC131428230 [Malaya genurostris]|uniref:uncharacterized protein LOC131428230 n=1 Tax=Malaya genurostris TaxID=325434 RepID=UPI0026F3C4ED|nr:uncharacterized protein LOC131428230 [Malaya genurostris]